MEITGREIMWNLPAVAGTIMYALFGIVVLVLIYGAYRRIQLYRSGRKEYESRTDNAEERLLNVIREGLLQRRVLMRPFGGGIHLMIYSAFIALFIATCLVALQYDFGFQILHGKFFAFFEVVTDTFGLVLMAGALLAFFRRYILNPPGLTKGGDDLLQLLLIFSIVVTGFIVEGLRIAATSPDSARFSYGGLATSRLFKGAEFSSIISAHKIMWWVHLVLAFSWIASLPFSKTIHIFTSPINMFLRSSRPKGALQPIPDIEDQEKLGVTDVFDHSWKSLLSADACTKCGRCQDVCPAYNTGKSLSPREIVLKTKEAMTGSIYTSLVPSAAIIDKKTGKQIESPYVGEVITPEEVWACTTCRACMEECPVSIEHIDMIVDMRRGLVFESKVPDTARTALMKMMNTGNPWGLPQDDRVEWMKDLDIPLASEKKSFEYLYWVGCAGAYDMRNQKVSKAIVKILNSAGVDYAVLGLEEMCCGESSRRLGEEGLFQLGMIEMNRETFATYNVKKVITQCPHCFNTFRNEYPQFGIEFEEVIHHSVFISNLIREGRIKPEKLTNEMFAFHDSCYLGRHNDIYDEPRSILEQVPGITLHEMEKSRENSFCCGAGGGLMWMEEEGERINLERISQAIKSGATGIASACPYCLIMFDDAAKAKNIEEEFRTKDIAEIVVESM